MIAVSLDDPRLHDYRYVADHDALRARGLFVAEGRLVVERLVTHRRHAVRSILLSPAAHDAMGAFLAATAPEADVYVVPQADMNAVVGFQIHRGCLALASRDAPASLDGLDLAVASRILVLEGVNNPDNVGGLFRNAAALGCAAVVLGPGCGDPLYRKAIRTSMAAVLTTPWAESGRWPDALMQIRHAGLGVVACSPLAERSLYDCPLPSRAAVLVGAEGAGLTRDALEAADIAVRIPMYGAMDSLNVATAAAIVLSELGRRAYCAQASERDTALRQP